MYLIFDTHEEMETRNAKGVTGTDPEDLGWSEGTTKYRWADIELDNGKWALNVGNGEGLTEEELANCVTQLP